MAAGRAELEERLESWAGSRPAKEAVAEMHVAGVVAERAYSIIEHPTYAERGDSITVTDPELGPVKMQAPLPHFTNHPGRIWRTAPQFGEDGDLDYAGLSEAEYERLRRQGAIGARP